LPRLMNFFPISYKSIDLWCAVLLFAFVASLFVFQGSVGAGDGHS